MKPTTAEEALLQRASRECPRERHAPYPLERIPPDAHSSLTSTFWSNGVRPVSLRPNVAASS